MASARKRARPPLLDAKGWVVCGAALLCELLLVR